MRYLIIFLLTPFFGSSQELWQLQPYAPDSNYVIGALPSGEPYWIHKDSLGISGGGGGGTITGNGTTNMVAYWASADSLTHDTMFSYLPASDRLGLGIDIPTGLGVGLHVNGTTFTDIHLTNPTTGTTAADGTSLFISSSDAYLTNRENGDVVIATQNIERIRVNETGTVNVSSLDTDGTAPTTSGTTRKVISDANGLLSFKTDTDGTVTSVGLTTGNSGTDVNVSGSPITTSGNITLNLPSSSVSNRGLLTSSDWSLFNGKLGSVGLSIGTSGTNINVSGSPLTSDGSITLNVPTASASNRGALSSTDWSAFNSKVGGSGTISRVAFWTGSNTLSSNTNFYYDNANSLLGLHIAPTHRLHIYDNTNSSAFRIASGATGGFYIRSGAANDGEFSAGYEFISGTPIARATSASGMNFYNGGTYFVNNSGLTSGSSFSANYAMTVLPTAVGINTNSPARRLDVNGELRVRDMVTDNPTFLAAVDNDGDFARVTVSTGLQLVGTTLSVNGVGTVSSISGANGIVTSPNPIVATGTVNLTGQALALHNLATNGIIARTGAGTVAARTITAGDGIAMTNGNGVSGNPTIFNVIASHGQLYNTGNLLNQTFDATYREIDFTATISSNMTTNTTNNSITIPATGTYEISYSGSYSLDASGINSLYLNLYQNGLDYGYRGQLRSKETTTSSVNSELFPFSRTFIAEFTSGDVLELYYQRFAGTATTIDFFNMNFSVKRLK